MAAPSSAIFSTLRASARTGSSRAGSAQPSRAETIARLDALSVLLDTAFTIPGTRIRFGIDGIIGLVPGIGDLVSTALSSYIIWEARKLGVPRWKIARMVANTGFDALVGAVPFLGDAVDVLFRANRRNMKILRDHVAAEEARGTIDAEYTVVRGGR